MALDTGEMTRNARRRRDMEDTSIKLKRVFFALLAACLLLAGCSFSGTDSFGGAQAKSAGEFSYDGALYEEVNENQPEFSESDYTTEAFERYSELDSLGRCGAAYANICRELMPTEERGSIGQVKPSGWHTVKYGRVDGKYLYNRCHLIAFQLAGENANEKNLITGTRSFNTEGMLPFENEVAEYVKETGNHVLYRVTPVFDGDNLVASGVTMEAYSVEDGGEGVSFHVFVYNREPGIVIDYATGESREDDGAKTENGDGGRAGTGSKAEDMPDEEESARQGRDEGAVTEYVLNTNTKRFHKPDCASAGQIKPNHRKEYEGTREELVEDGYQACGSCRP